MARSSLLWCLGVALLGARSAAAEEAAPPPREWLVEVTGESRPIAARSADGSRPVATAGGETTLLLETLGDLWGWGHWLMASIDSDGRVVRKRWLGEELGDHGSIRAVALLPNGDALLAAEGLDELVVVRYGSEGSILWTRRLPATAGYERFGAVATGPGPAETLWVVGLEIDYGSEIRYRLLEFDQEGELVADVLPVELGAPSSDAPPRLLGASGDRVYLLDQDSFGRTGTQILALGSGGETLWRSAVFDDSDREAVIVAAEVAEDGRLAVLGAGSDWLDQRGDAAPAARKPSRELFDPDPWDMMAVALLGADGERLAVTYESLPEQRDLLPREVRFGADGGLYVAALASRQRSAAPEFRARVYAYDADLERLWHQDTWDLALNGDVAIAPRPAGGVALLASACPKAGECRLRIASISERGRVEMAALGPAVARRWPFDLGVLSADFLGGRLRVGYSRADEAGSERFEYAEFDDSVAPIWLAGIETPLPVQTRGSTGLAAVGSGAVVLAGRSGDSEVLVRVDSEGGADLVRPLHDWLGIGEIRSLPAAGLVVAGTATSAPAPQGESRTEDFSVARLDSQLEAAWSRSTKGPGSRWDRAQRVEVRDERICVAGQSTWTGEAHRSESRLFCRDLEGELLWSARVDGPEAAAFETRLAISPDGDVAVTSAAYSYDGLDLVVFDGAGAPLWQRREDAPLEELGLVRVLGLGFSADGELRLAAQSWARADQTGLWSFDPAGGIRWIWDPLAAAGGPLTTAPVFVDERTYVAGCLQHWIGGAQEPFVAAVGAAGETLWTARFPGPVDCGWMRLGLDACGRPILAARLFPAGRTVGVASLSSAGEVRWLDRIESVDTLLPSAWEHDGATGATWLELERWGLFESVLLARYREDCSSSP